MSRPASERLPVVPLLLLLPEVSFWGERFVDYGSVKWSEAAQVQQIEPFVQALIPVVRLARWVKASHYNGRMGLRRRLRAIRSRAYIGWGMALFAACALRIILASYVTRNRDQDALLKCCAGWWLKWMGIEVIIEDSGGRDPGRPYVFVANHVSLVDPFLFTAVVSHPLRGVEAENHFRWPLWGSFVRQVGNIPIDNRSKSGVAGALKRAQKTLEQGLSIMMFPEGTRTLDGRLLPFKAGPFFLAQRAGVDIVPMIQLGAFGVNNKTTRTSGPGKITVVILPPIPFERFERTDIYQLRDTVKARMEQVFHRRAKAGADFVPGLDMPTHSHPALAQDFGKAGVVADLQENNR